MLQTLDDRAVMMHHAQALRRFAVCFLIAAMLLGLAGCERKPLGKVVFGTVTCGGEKAARGSVRFVPMGDTEGRASTAAIADGQYRFDRDGGLHLGRYRVEVDVERKTGRSVPDRAALGLMTDEWESISDVQYARDQSPLQIKVMMESDGRHDFDIPRRSN
jgi:hypothetical protein